VTDQVLDPYKTTGKIIVLYILIFVFLDTEIRFLKKVQNGKPTDGIRNKNLIRITNNLINNKTKYDGHLQSTSNHKEDLEHETKV
jgi:hypothetical protein